LRKVRRYSKAGGLQLILERYVKLKIEMKIDFDKVHDQCGWHEEAILESKKCGCFYCLRIFPPDEIIEWIKESENCPRGPGKTAVCPYCGIDSVLPDIIDYELTKEFLKSMQDKFFD
jgi:NAD-dependent SIR2 family protein deacetylase